ncbi:MAG: hypothetical protein JW849_06490 [Phycisphaerae bacterium]|nr:hypothetical protein [Phycisphaerae bacterium]
MMDRKKMLPISFLALLCIAVVGSYVFMDNHHIRALNAREDVYRCEQIFAQLHNLQQKPKLASDHEKLSSETTSLIERAAINGQIAPSSIERISPQPAKRIYDTPYKDKSINVTLLGITLRQLVQMAKSLSASKNDLIMKSIQLSPPNDKDTGDKWNVELVLSYLIYDVEQK